LCCARTHLDAAVAERLRQLLELDIDWKAFFHSARCHGLLALVYRNLSATVPGRVPQAVQDQYKAPYRTAAWLNVFLTAQLVQILRLLERNCIPAVPFKGPVLAATLYGDLTMREFTDLDILIPPKDVWRARDLLIAEGYRPQIALTQAEAASCFQSPKEHHFLLTNPDGLVVVELHWRLVQACFAFPLDSDRLWHHLVRVPLADSTVATFSAEDLLLILCQHGAKHGWNQLKLICDVAELLRAHPQLDWRRLRGRARKMGCERMVDLGLILTGQFLGTNVPHEAWNGRQIDPMVKSLAHDVFQRFLQRDPDGSDPEDKWGFYLKARERWRDRVQVCRGLGAIPAGTDWTVFPLRARFCYYLAMAVLPNQRDHAVVNLPGAFSLLYFLVRPVRLTGKYLRVLAQCVLDWWRSRR
jgi:hypothetical protein